MPSADADNTSGGRAAIIIAAYRCERWVDACLTSLADSISPKHWIFILDNAENNNSVPASIRHANYKVLKSPRPMGFAEANNFTLTQLDDSFEYVCFLNQDTISSHGWLDCCIECLERDSSLGAVMPMQTQYDGTGEDPACRACVEKATERTSVSTSFGELSLTITTELTAAALVVRSVALQKAGPFDAVFESYCEDFDLTDRIAALGWRLGIVDGPRVQHFSGSASTNPKARIRKDALSISNRALLRCRRKRTGRWLTALHALTVEPVRRIARSFLGRPGANSLQSIMLAYRRLLQMAPRLFVSRIDRSCFAEQMKTLGWKAFESQKYGTHE